jgi:DNA invertase Pin-like site-specific DNA recombinase
VARPDEFREGGMLVGYARVSTREQNQALQLDALRAAGCERVYTEKASGAQRERPELKAALDYAREGDTLVVEDLEQRKIGLRSLTEAIDTTTPGGRLVFHVFAALAEFERSVIRERTTAGLEAARARGRKGGQGYRIWSRTSFQHVVIGSGPAVQRWEGRLKGHVKLGHSYQKANLTRASSRKR